ncbi:tetraspanin-8-like [Gossypium hirsutum]|uniref:Tetraspanin-8-like n=1 Tax=Gossypium hirsutum TaxID=3635 RepID=A0ABM3AEG2_GOSHI|nr:tetraspanin-8-like [Gossypium hirsutum]
MFVYLGVMLLCLIGFTVFVFLITNNDAGKVFSEKEFFVKERKTMDFSHWLQNHFVNDKNWNRIKSCLIDARVCTSGRNANGVNYNLSLQYRVGAAIHQVHVGSNQRIQHFGKYRNLVQPHRTLTAKHGETTHGSYAMIVTHAIVGY